MLCINCQNQLSNIEVNFFFDVFGYYMQIFLPFAKQEYNTEKHLTHLYFLELWK